MHLRERGALTMAGLGASIRSHMTVCPVTIRGDQPLADAHRAMREGRIRHLPVLLGGQLVGVVSQRDLYFFETIAGVDVMTVSVEEAMSDPPFVVDPGASVRRVVQEMARNRYGCAVVAERGEVVGVFTTTDAVKLLARLLGEEQAARPSRRRRARRAS
jgi:acetoin utilization protein AcuB